MVGEGRIGGGSSSRLWRRTRAAGWSAAAQKGLLWLGNCKR